MSRVANSSTLHDAADAADALLDLLHPVCERIEIAGSVRRRKDEINDIEVVAIAKTQPVKHASLFGPEDADENLLDRFCQRAARFEVEGLQRPYPVATPRGQKRPRQFPWGDKHKRLTLLNRGRWFCIDLFITTPAQWGSLFAIRTGPSDFSRLLVTPRAEGGAMPPRHRQSGGFLQRLRGPDDWENIDTPEEADYFAALGVPLWEPRLRCERLLREHLGQRPTSSAAKAPYSPFGSEFKARH